MAPSRFWRNFPGCVLHKASLPLKDSSCVPLFYAEATYEGLVLSLIDQIPPTFVDNNPLISPLAILDFKTVNMGGNPTRYALVQWEGLSLDDTYWEKWDELKSLFDLEDKVNVKGGGIDIVGNIRSKRMTRRPARWSNFIHS
ncbi:hypothetical protein V8G54_025007 [Vigna mungo]|uniref:Chromo domain-containing protein n=1 Tax=Vigna mungo TaxID=3915 RepID=A0AAQ3RTY0_VIGMU